MIPMRMTLINLQLFYVISFSQIILRYLVNERCQQQAAMFLNSSNEKNDGKHECNR
jgi:hypothetical protein